MALTFVGYYHRPCNGEQKKPPCRMAVESCMNIKNLMAESLGREFVGLVADALDARKMRQQSHYYRTH